MPRSGTTLVEKIAASHRDVYGAGERNTIPTVVKNLEREANKKREFPELIINLSKIESIELANSDIEMLQDLITAAVNDASSKSQDLANDKLSSITGGMNIPGMM